MDVFEYVAVMVTVVLALGLSHLLTALASMLVHPERVRLYWVHSVWILSILALHLQAWLVLWTRRHQPEFPFSQVTMMLAAAALIFVTARVLVPEGFLKERRRSTRALLPDPKAVLRNPLRVLALPHRRNAHRDRCELRRHNDAVSVRAHGALHLGPPSPRCQVPRPTRARVVCSPALSPGRGWASPRQVRRLTRRCS